MSILITQLLAGHGHGAMEHVGQHSLLLSSKDRVTLMLIIFGWPSICQCPGARERLYYRKNSRHIWVKVLWLENCSVFL